MPELILTEAQNGERLSVRVGDSITIELPETAAAGYRWSASRLETARFELESQTHRQTRGGVGSAGTSVWRLRATSAGTTRLELKKSRPWESGVPAADVFAVDLDITG
jgi:inhibitor of cysteine peptidase